MRPVLALHCGLASGRSWGALAAACPEAAFTCPDLPGHGGAPDWDPAQDFQSQALDLAWSVAPPEPFDVVGHSFGGTLALRLAVEHPGRVRSVTLIEPVLFAAAAQPDRDAHEADMRPLAAALARDDRAAAAAFFHGIWGGGSWAALPSRGRDQIISRIHLIQATEPAILTDMHDVLARLPQTIPVLIVTRQTPPKIMASIADGLLRRMPQAQATSVGRSHMIPQEAPQALAERLRAFWKT